MTVNADSSFFVSKYVPDIKASVKPWLNLWPVNTSGMAATGADISEFQEREETHTGCLLTMSDNEIGKIGPVLGVLSKSVHMP